MTRWTRLVLLALLAVATTGCGLKGPLTLPSRSDEIVIRGPGQSTTEPATAPAPAATPAGPREERPPPPPLPGSSAGARGG